jgi:hypothetical protein
MTGRYLIISTSTRSISFSCLVCWTFQETTFIQPIFGTFYILSIRHFFYILRLILLKLLIAYSLKYSWRNVRGLNVIGCIAAIHFSLNTFMALIWTNVSFMFIDKYLKAVLHTALQMFVVSRAIFWQWIPAFFFTRLLNGKSPNVIPFFIQCYWTLKRNC